MIDERQLSADSHDGHDGREGRDGREGHDGRDGHDEHATCALCAAVGPPPLPAGWSVQLAARGRGLEHLCPACTRTNARSIEARLQPEWW